MQDNHLPTKELQAIDAAHHIHPFTDRASLNAKGARVITRAQGIYLWDSEGDLTSVFLIPILIASSRSLSINN